MNKLISEEQLLHDLDIPDWRHMNKDKIIEFASSMRYLSPEVAKKAIEQFPNFSKMGNEIVSVLKESLDITNQENSKITNRILDENSKILNILEQRLNKPFISRKERDKLIDAMVYVSNNTVELDKQNKNFLSQGLKVVGTVASLALIIGGSILGVKISKDI